MRQSGGLAHPLAEPPTRSSFGIYSFSLSQALVEHGRAGSILVVTHETDHITAARTGRGILQRVEHSHDEWTNGLNLHTDGRTRSKQPKDRRDSGLVPLQVTSASPRSKCRLRTQPLRFIWAALIGRGAFTFGEVLGIVSSDMGSDDIRVGVLFSSTGATAVVERTQRNAVEMALDEINSLGGVLGRRIVASYSDPASIPRRYRESAVRMMESEGVRVFFGCYMSSTRKAILPVIEENKALLFYPTLYEGFEFSAHCYYGGAAPNQNSIGLALHLMENFGQTFYLVGSNYVFPYESNRIMRDFIVSSGGRVLQERYVPLVATESDIAKIVEDIRSRPPHAIISTIVGDATTLLYRACRKAGFDPAKMPIGSITTGEPEVAAMGAEAAAGQITSAPYFDTIDSAENVRFVSAYRRRFGVDSPISACTEAAYFQVHLFAQAVERAGSDRIEDLRQALPGCSFEAPQGLVRIDADNNHTFLCPRIGRVGPDGRFEIVAASPGPVKPDPYLITPLATDWGLKVAAVG
jgi:branched-chain amino acid transport system substrate-binding protein